MYQRQLSDEELEKAAEYQQRIFDQANANYLKQATYVYGIPCTAISTLNKEMQKRQKMREIEEEMLRDVFDSPPLTEADVIKSLIPNNSKSTPEEDKKVKVRCGSIDIDHLRKQLDSLQMGKYRTFAFALKEFILAYLPDDENIEQIASAELEVYAPERPYLTADEVDAFLDGFKLGAQYIKKGLLY